MPLDGSRPPHHKRTLMRYIGDIDSPILSR